jgi:transposase
MQGKAMPDQTARTQFYAGVDVCKDWLDVHLHPLGESHRFTNDADGVGRLKRLCRKHGVVKIVMEATGKHQRLAHRALSAAGFATAVVNPLRARLFAEANGTLAKTDRIDARMLALMAEKLDPRATRPAPKAIEELQEFVRARDAAVAEKTALMNRRGEAKIAALQGELDRLIDAMQEHVDRLEKEINRRINADATLKHRRALLMSIPGIGPIAAAALLADLDELGACSNKAAVMLVGLAPIAREDRCGPRSTCRRSPPEPTIHSSNSSMNGSSPPEKRPRSLSPPSCENSSSSPTRSCVKTDPGASHGLDSKHRCSSDLASRGCLLP